MSWSRLRRFGEPETGVDERALGDIEPLGERIPIVGRPAQLVGADLVARDATFTEVGTSSAGIGSLEETLVIPVDRLFHGLDQPRSLGPTSAFVGRRVRERHARLGRQSLHRPDEIQALDLADEGDGVAALLDNRSSGTALPVG